MRRPVVFALGGVVLALGALGALLFVLVEPVRAIEAVREEVLRDDPDGQASSEQQQTIEGRLDEAGSPLLGASILAALALGAALVARRSTVGAAAVLLACVALAGAAYVWARYGEGIWSRLG